MVTVFSRRAVMAGTIGGAFLLTGCDVSRPAPPSPSPHESTASPTAIEPQTDESIQYDVLARLAAAGITSINVDVDAHGHGGAHVFIDGSIESLDQLLQALQIGYDTASEHQDYAVLATVTRAGTGRVGRRALEVTWALDENAEIGPRPEQLRPSARAALTMFPDAEEDATLQVDVNLDGMSASALVTCRQTSTASAAETYRRLRPAWRVPAGATRTGFALGRGGVFLGDSTMDLTRHRAARVPSAMLSAWTTRLRSVGEPWLTTTTQADGGTIVTVKFTDPGTKGPTAVDLATAMIDAHGASTADLEIQGTKGAATIEFDAQYCQPPVTAATRETYAYYAKHHPKAARRHHLDGCR